MLQAQYAKGERGVWKGNFYKLLDSAQKKAFTSANILDGFRNTRLWPIDFSVVEERMKFGSTGKLLQPANRALTQQPVTPL